MELRLIVEHDYPRHILHYFRDVNGWYRIDPIVYIIDTQRRIRIYIRALNRTHLNFILSIKLDSFSTNLKNGDL